MSAAEKAELDRFLLHPSLSSEGERFYWPGHAHPYQLPPEGDWQTWVIRAGRGSGKTRAGAEWVRMQAEADGSARIALVGATSADVRDVMVDGPSGILAVSPDWFRPVYEPSRRRLTWPNGAVATTFSAEEPDRLRGPQHSKAWTDEVAAWTRPDAWDMLLFGLRIGQNPQVVVTTTPRPTKQLKELLAHPRTVETRGSSYDNRANLAAGFFDAILRRYEGTRLGRQEILAEILDDNPAALWSRAMLEACRVTAAPPVSRVVVAVDPSGGDGEGAAEAGIVVAGLGTDGHGYILADRTLRGSPDQWGKEAVAAYHTHRADRLVAEVNYGGAMVQHVVKTVDPSVAYRAVTASRGKQLRAEPVAALYEQGRVHHAGTFPALEDQMAEWCPGDPSPDRLDALVWCLTELMLGVVGEWEFY